MMRIQAESWYEMKLSSCTNGELLLGNDNVFHLCVYLLFMWISLTLIYAVAVFFRISVKDHGSQELLEWEQCIFPYLWTMLCRK